MDAFLMSLFQVDYYFNKPITKMKKIALFIMLIISVKNYSQVSISPSERGANEEFKGEDLNDFKKTTTVFILSNVYKKEDYEKILKEVWTVTPFIVVDYNDFKVNEYANGNFSIAKLFGDIIETSHGPSVGLGSTHGMKYIHVNLVVKTINSVKFQKSFAKLKPEDKKYSRKLRTIFDENSSFIAKVPLCVNNKFLNEIMRSETSYEKLSILYEKMYTETSFTNTNLGMLKNYFQQISQSLNKGEHYGLHDDFSKPEIKKLKDDVLYIPEVYMMEYNPWKGTEKIKDDKDLKKLLEHYKYKFEFIADSDLEKRILNNEEIFYLRYVSMNANKYLQVVNGKTGEPAYYFYGAMTYNLKDDDFKNINKAINAK